MASQFERKYRCKGHVLDDTFFNDRFKDVDLRLVSLEQQIEDLDEVSNALVERGLTFISNELRAQVTALETTVANATASLTTLQDAVDEAIERLNEDLIIDSGTW